MTLLCEEIAIYTKAKRISTFAEVNRCWVFVIVRGKYLFTVCEMINGRKTRIAISFRISNLLIDRN